MTTSWNALLVSYVAFRHTAKFCLMAWLVSTVVVVVVVHQSQSERLEYLKNGLTENHQILQGNSFTGYDVNSYFQSELSWKKLFKLPPPTAFDRISWEQSKRGSPNCTHLSGTIGLTNLLNMTWLTSSCRLQNAIKYCTKQVRLQSRIIWPLFGVESTNFARPSKPT